MKGPSPGRFQQIFSEGDRANSPNLTMYVLSGSGAIGVTTSRKIGCRARRNRVRRRVREIARIQESRLAKWDSVIVAKASADHAKFETVCNDLGQLIDELERRWEKQSESF
ncbi:MAG: ribonuclease P protein component [Fimbriimonadaceae bacterium]